MEAVKIKRVVVEFDNGSQVTWEYPNATIQEERGFHRCWSVLGELPVIEPNGHRRLTIKAWAGCPSYDTFRTDI